MANPKSSNILSRSANYVSACVHELRYKVTWPTWKELSDSSLLVLGASIIMSLFIFLVDQAFEFLITGLYSIIAG